MREPFVKFIETQLEDDSLLITCGLPATYKTETSEEISKIKGYPMLRTDIVRLEVLKGEDVFDEKVASDMTKRKKVYDEVFRRADEALSEGGGLIIDATFVKQSLRRRAAELAAKHDRTFVILQTSCAQEVSLKRIARRTKEKYESNALTEQAYMNNKKSFEPVDMDDLKRIYSSLRILHLTVDTEKDVPEGWCIIGAERK